MERKKLLKLFVLANEFKEGDLLVGGTLDPLVRVEARRELSALRIGEVNAVTLVEDEVSEALSRSLNLDLTPEIAPLTVAEVRHILLGSGGAQWAERYRDGLSSEAIAAVVKVMSNAELAQVAQSLFNPLPGEGITIGAPRHFGSRIQPNSPGDDEEEILFSVLEGLSYGCGDVILGLNPASDDVDSIIRLEDLLRSVVERLALPTRYCVLSDIVKQATARTRTKVDVGFQSLAGTSKALAGMVGLDVEGILDLARGFPGLYFETGQGSEVTNGTEQGVDMVTLESRTYGVARYIRQRTGKWMIVNDVAGFIGPEVFRSEAQLLRTCLEDSVMAKLHGLTMGLDVCATFHMGIPPQALQKLTETIVEQAAPAYLMAVAGNADPMLSYLTTSFREHPRLRLRTGRTMSSAMQARLTELGVLQQGQPIAETTTTAALYAEYIKAGGDARAREDLCAEAQRKLGQLRQRGFDLGYGCGPGYAAPAAVEKRLDALYSHARRALYARLDAVLLKTVSPNHLRVRTCSMDREDYLSHPPSGERLCDADAGRVTVLYASRRPQVQVVLSDGLNADALNDNLRAILPPLRHGLAALDCHVGVTDIVIENGRVRAGYHVGALLDVEVVIHLIGERPGTGLNMLSAYLTFGRDGLGHSRWSVDLDHARTTAVCGIHRQGKRPEDAAEEIVRLVKLMLERRCSGVSLGAGQAARMPLSSS
jgi:ethanolamine ammonia-lyase large subunit